MLDFKDYVKNQSSPADIHVFVDKNPCIHILLTTRVWSRLFSLAGILQRGKVVVLKGVDGTLYHGQDVLEKFIEPNTRIEQYEVNRLGQETHKVDRTRTGIEAPREGFIHALNEVHEFVTGFEKRFKNDPRSKWLVKIPSKALNKTPSFDGWGGKPKMQHTPGAQLWQPKQRPTPQYATSNPGRGASSATSSQGLGTGTSTLLPDSATNRVRKMVEKMEADKKAAEEKEKEQKGTGILRRVFGGSKRK
ncbi:hypothetical protein BN14_11260 [Rhizoctonia solani AG-1 IB]|nr:hypothetical protein BN14_11260 [Rhizoctonia solani AG-1 IB]